MVLLPDSPAPEKRRKPDFELICNQTQKLDINMSDNSKLMETTGPGKTLVRFSVYQQPGELH